MTDISNAWPSWRPVDELGEGSFGKVYKIEKPIPGTGMMEYAALKVISIPHNSSELDTLRSDGYKDVAITDSFRKKKDDIMREYALMAKLKGGHNIVYCEEVKEVPHKSGMGWDVFIKMELLTPLKKSLFNEDYSEEDTVRLGMDMCRALAMCEKNKIIHRDIKPENILVTDMGDYKLGDFGVAKISDHTTEGTMTGSLPYMAPEVWKKEGYNASVDIYSLGMVMYWMMNKKKGPFLPKSDAVPTTEQKEIAFQKRMLGNPLPRPVNGSDALVNIVLKACAFNPKDRFRSADEMMNALMNLNNILDPSPEKRVQCPRCRHLNANKAKYCEKCGTDLDKKTDEEHKKKIYCAVGFLTILLFAYAIIMGLSKGTEEQVHTHSWTAATCTAPKMCTTCGEVSGKELGHQWTDATCISSKTCDICGMVSGSALGHDWINATCTSPKTCAICGMVSESILGHDWIEATYDAPKTCINCGATEGTVLEKVSQLRTPAQGMIAAGTYHSAYLYPDGTVFAVGSDKLSEYDNSGTRLDVSSWTDIVAISASSHTVGLKSDGTVVACGVNRYGQCDLSGWSDIVAICAGDDHTVGLRCDGTVVAKGNNEDGQCDVSHWRDIIDVAACKNTTFGLKSDGTIISAGPNNYGYTWKNIASICGGAYDLVGLRNDGTVVATGSSDSWSKNTLASWRNVVEISASSTHIVGLKADGTVVACGKERAAEACGVKRWTDIVQVCAGMYFTIGLKSDGTIVSVGENAYHQCDLG